jgi:hypothetical protein
MIKRIRRNLPLALLGVSFLLLGLTTQCGSPQPTDGTGTRSTLGCSNDGDCQLPASTCGAPNELDYSTDPKCVNGECQFTMASRECACYSGGCQFNETVGVIDVDAFGGPPSPEPDASDDHSTVASPDAGECSADTDASACVTPPSVCVDVHWMAYFTNAACSQSRCQWDVAYRDCGGLGCSNGGCVMNVTK